MPLVLASTSPYRRQLLNRLQIPFSVAAPFVDETPIIAELPDARALRLAEEKALALAAEYPDSLILGGDQTIADGECLFDKPGTRDNAIAQLLQMCGRQLTFFTAVALADTSNGSVTTRLLTHRARFRMANENEIRRYVEKEDATNCAGGAQIEGLGISLMDDIRGGDPTALIGMPLICVASLLRQHGIAIP
ncbi:MAG: Maf family nucleotide pyrophosphatase [Proteobacteria bacterium]|nr:Maf family nucleotide pyrophosphatase [Pseudomonadota bacterium]